MLLQIETNPTLPFEIFEILGEKGTKKVKKIAWKSRIIFANK
jgi:hypothetical protein